MSAGTSEFFCLICLLLCSCTALEITAKLGQDVILPCKVPNNYNINNITVVEWIRPGLGSEHVFLYQDGRFDPDSQHPSYQNRVDLQDKEMKDGNVSLTLKNVKMEDTGTYECHVTKKEKTKPISIINLEVLPPDHSWKTIVGVVVTLVVIILSAGGFAVYKILQNRKWKTLLNNLQEENEPLERSYSEIKNQLQQKTQENEALINQLMKLVGNNLEINNQLQQQKQKNEALENELKELEGNNSDTINPLQKKKLNNRTPMNRLKKRSHSDDRSELQLVKERNETLNSRLMKLEKLQDENQKLKETVGYLQTKLQNMNQEGELMGTKTAEHIPE